MHNIKSCKCFVLEICTRFFSLPSYLHRIQIILLPSPHCAHLFSESKIKMVFGILEPASNITPSGTNLIESLDNASNPEGAGTQVILVPKPSGSPLDPLNWPRHKKELLFATIVFGACAAGSLGPVVVPGFTAVAVLLDV
ncbi:cd5ec8f9-eea9-4797-b5c7-5a60995536e3-CDS [Sclerotinia trifoliorum]|uniref:Cd5ec8f9-eea9-4797-b5c7-5a60995536e3-CDS n=1 Tax=Sclerotinia trifoliorum TaxID=28548 RepID=A0A8H2ZSC3_9HELO|nr:cd5ec8f9-eea9-4797-b5c7-5a60995536e3-CDS [Sclerotinia trifoliorum]